MIRVLAAGVLCTVLATSGTADPNPQLVSLVQFGLKSYGLDYDVSKFATSTVARLHFALTSTEDYVSTLAALEAILRNPVYK